LHALSTTTPINESRVITTQKVRTSALSYKGIVSDNNLKSQLRKWLSALHACIALRTHTYFMTGREVKEQLWRDHHGRHYTQHTQLF